MLATPDTAPDTAANAAWVGLRRRLWLLPLLASLVFVAGVLAWAYRADRDERVDRRATMIADALSSEAQLRDRLGLEMASSRPWRANCRCWPARRPACPPARR